MLPESKQPKIRQGENQGTEGLSPLRPPEVSISIQDLMGKNFLGVAAWEKLGVSLNGALPEFQAWLTKKYLLSPCPLHSGLQVKDTHLLVLIPQSISGTPLTARRLEEAFYQSSAAEPPNPAAEGDIARVPEEKKFDVSPTESYWALIAKSDSTREITRRFLGKSSREMHKVRAAHYRKYANGNVLEMMAGIILYKAMTGERLYQNEFALCAETDPDGDNYLVGQFRPPSEREADAPELGVLALQPPYGDPTGYALVRV